MRSRVAGSVLCALAALVSAGVPATGAGALGQRHNRAAVGVVTTVCGTPGGRLKDDARILEYRLASGFGVAHAAVSIVNRRCLRVTVPPVTQSGAIVRAALQRGYVALTASDHVALSYGLQVRLACKRRGCAPGGVVAKANLAARPHPIMSIVIPQEYMARQSAEVARDSAGGPTVVYSLTAKGSSTWCAYTGSHMGRYVAVVVDERVVSDPEIMDAICTTQSQIVGFSTFTEARAIAAYLNYGPLPMTLKRGR